MHALAEFAYHTNALHVNPALDAFLLQVFLDVSRVSIPRCPLHSPVTQKLRFKCFFQASSKRGSFFTSTYHVRIHMTYRNISLLLALPGPLGNGLRRVLPAVADEAWRKVLCHILRPMLDAISQCGLQLVELWHVAIRLLHVNVDLRQTKHLHRSEYRLQLILFSTSHHSGGTTRVFISSTQCQD